MSQHFGDVDPLSIYDYSLPYHNPNINQEIAAVNAVENTPFNKCNPEESIQNSQFNENNPEIPLANVQNDQIIENGRLESFNDVAQTELNNLPDNNVKHECNDVNYSNDVKNLMNDLSLDINRIHNENLSNQSTENIAIDVKPFEKGKRKVKKERSTYWSEKITDKDFPFYGCAVCNICYVDLPELDKHIATHKDRTTSYDLRVKNQLKRKKLKKEKKKLKKLSKGIKKEKELIDIEIKPEDGYIGNEKASEFECKDGKNSESMDRKELSVKEGTDNKTNVESQSKIDNSQELMNLQKIFKCFACQKQFTLSYYLKLHVRSHTDEKPYKCPTCSQSFITASKLGRHNKRFHLQIKYQCRICFRFFSRFECLTAHFDRKHPDDKIEGEPYDYNAILPYLKELEEELKRKSEETKLKKEESFLESWDGAKNETEPGLMDLKHEPETNEMSGNHFMCNGNDFVDQNEEYPNIPLGPHEQVLAKPIEVIIEEMKPDVEQPAEKIEIEIKTEVIDQFEDENMKDESDDDSKVKNESGSDEEYFPDNTWTSTKEDSPPPVEGDTADPLTCRVCKKKISSTSYMKIHMRTHTGEKPFKCYICNTGFITSSKMHRHVLNVHTTVHGDGAVEIKKEESTDKEVKPKKEKTDEEGNKLENGIVEQNRNEILAMVLQNARKVPKKDSAGSTDSLLPADERSRVCNICGEVFQHFYYLEEHLKNHASKLAFEDEEKPEDKKHVCQVCNKSFKLHYYLKLHSFTHTKEKPYICQQCGKGFITRGKLKRHLETHEGLKKFQCHVCYKFFTRPSYLRTHVRTIHGTQDYNFRLAQNLGMTYPSQHA